MTQPTLIIIGAPRSGTNMLRDLVCCNPGVSTWPCDELPFVWRHGNTGWPDDEIPVSKASSDVRQYIRACFERFRKRSGADVIVEKTCANSLRVPFVDRIFPGTRFVFIHRDGVDAAASAVHRWKAGFDAMYTLRKLRDVPFTDIPRHAGHFLRNRVHRLRSGEQRLAWWGPKPAGVDALPTQMALPDMAAWQWNACAMRAASALRALPAERVLTLKYETFVADPESGIEQVLAHAGIDRCDDEGLIEGLERISSGSVGKGRSTLGAQTSARLDEIQIEGRAAIAALSGA